MDDSRGKQHNTGGGSLGDDRQAPLKVPPEKRLSRFSTLLPKQPGGSEAPHGGGSTATVNRPERQSQASLNTRSTSKSFGDDSAALPPLDGPNSRSERSLTSTQGSRTSGLSTTSRLPPHDATATPGPAHYAVDTSSLDLRSVPFGSARKEQMTYLGTGLTQPTGDPQGATPYMGSVSSLNTHGAGTFNRAVREVSVVPGSPPSASRESQSNSPLQSPSHRPSSAVSPSHRHQSQSQSRQSQSLPPAGPYVQDIEDSERVQLCPSMAASDDPPPLRPRSATAEPTQRHNHRLSNISTTGTLQLDDDVRLVSGRTGLPPHKASSPPSRPGTHGGHRPRDEEEEKFIQELRRLQGDSQRSPKGGNSDSLGLSNSGSGAKRPPSAVFNRTPRFNDNLYDGRDGEGVGSKLSVPGPASYDVGRSMDATKRHVPGASLNTAIVHSDSSKALIPGPGAYELAASERPHAPAFSFPTDKRFLDTGGGGEADSFGRGVASLVGPGSYDVAASSQHILPRSPAHSIPLAGLSTSRTVDLNSSTSSMVNSARSRSDSRPTSRASRASSNVSLDGSGGEGGHLGYLVNPHNRSRAPSSDSFGSQGSSAGAPSSNKLQAALAGLGYSTGNH